MSVKDDSKATLGGAPKFIYSQHPSKLADPVLSYWGMNENGKDDESIKEFDPTKEIFSSENEQVINIQKYIDLWLSSNKTNRFQHASKAINSSIKDDKNWPELSIMKGHGYGLNFEDVFKLITYWNEKFKLENQIKKLSQYKQFMTEVNGLNIHFIKQSLGDGPDKGQEDEKKDEAVTSKSNKNKCDAILLLHGWPGSIWEFHRVLDELKVNKDDAFKNCDIIVPSLPGYGFSDYPTSKTRFTCVSVADIMIKLMEERLKYKNYYVVAGDWGYFVAKIMAMRISCYEPKDTKLLGVLLNNAFTSASDQDMASSKITVDMSIPMIKQMMLSRLDMGGYQLLHSTRPNTIGILMESSPIGVLTWIYEKYLSWTDSPNKLSEIKYDDNGQRIISGDLNWDDVIMTACIYWLNGRVTSGLNYYIENMGWAMTTFTKYYVPENVKIGIIKWEDIIERSFDPNNKYHFRNIVMEKKMKAGGHFAGLERPKEYVANIAEFIKKCNENETKTEKL